MAAASLALCEAEASEEAAQHVIANRLIRCSGEEALQGLGISRHSPNLSFSESWAPSNARVQLQAIK